MTFDIRGVQKAEPVGHLLDEQTRRRWIRLREHACLRVSRLYFLDEKWATQAFTCSRLILCFVLSSFTSSMCSSSPAWLSNSIQRKLGLPYVFSIEEKHEAGHLTVGTPDISLSCSEDQSRRIIRSTACRVASRRMQHLRKSTSADDIPAQPELRRFARKEQTQQMPSLLRLLRMLMPTTS